MWNRYHQTTEFSQPWLLRFFDQIRFYPVSHQELLQIRRDFPNGRYPLKIEETTFSLNQYQTFVAENQPEISRFQQQREQAFAEELANWHATGQFNFEAQEEDIGQNEIDIPDGATALDSSISGNVWQVNVAVGDRVEEGQALIVLESMKMEIPLIATAGGIVQQLLVEAGQRISAGQILAVLTTAEEE